MKIQCFGGRTKHKDGLPNKHKFTLGAVEQNVVYVLGYNFIL